MKAKLRFNDISHLLKRRVLYILLGIPYWKISSKYHIKILVIICSR